MVVSHGVPRVSHEWGLPATDRAKGVRFLRFVKISATFCAFCVALVALRCVACCVAECRNAEI